MVDKIKVGDVVVGNTYTSNNCGKFKVVSFLGGVKFSIQLENTGSTCEAVRCNDLLGVFSSDIVDSARCIVNNTSL